ncbi:unnamed protein product [Prorocentrum cordatum]|uniref:Pyruvate phosphate dikinase AMP/ATP-binding domain-containing protein n=1 Tax=Prorocentrum cordatum TaxID=2364126 RepID=A0ABN9VKI3_9DINO|nr:unnamed protein product [Polarella glacialis]
MAAVPTEPLCQALAQICSDEDRVVFREQRALEDADVVSVGVLVVAGEGGAVTVAIAVSSSVPLRLHWATADDLCGGWRPAPHGWVTRPARSFDAGGGAWATDLEEASPGVQLVEVELRAERAALAFVLRTHQDRFIKHHGRDIYAESGLTPECWDEEVLLDDHRVVGFATKAWCDDAGVAHVLLAAGAREALALHWGLVERAGGRWRRPPQGWAGEPPGSKPCGDGALETPFEHVSEGSYRLQLDLPHGRFSSLAFVLRLAGGIFVKRGGRDMLLALPGRGEHSEASGGGPSSEQHMPREERHPAPHHSEDPPAGQDEVEDAAEERPALPPAVARAERNLSDLQRQLGKLAGGGSFDRRLVDEIVRNEEHCQRSLMHRYNFAAELLQREGAPGGIGQDQLVVLFVWLRFMSMRQLVINRNYNIKPREISAAQERVTLTLAAVLQQRPELREVAWVTMATIGRGGAGDTGQQIRDQILEVQKRNDCKGGMMEEWHQKLHNNTCPDDVSICEALLAYIEEDLDVGAYWSRLAKDNVTRERLASYDRKICSEPRFRPEQRRGLARDLTDYLRTLKAVHSGTDLESAIDAVLGKTTLPERLRELLAATQLLAKDVRGEGAALAALEAAVEARWELQPLLDQAGRQRAGGAQGKDLLYLDMALEATVRTVVEGALARLGQSAPEEVMAVAAVVLESLAISAGSNEELLRCLRSWRSAASCTRGPAELALRVKAAAERVGAELAARGDRFACALQPAAEALGRGLGVDADTLGLFSEQVARGGAAAPLAQLLRVLDPMLRGMADMGAWQVISSFEAQGRVLCVSGLASLQHASLEEATVLVAERVGGEEDIPEGAVALLTPDAPDVLSHVAVRARNERKLFATVFDAEAMQALRALAGKVVLCRPAPAGDSVAIEAATGSEPSPRAPAAPCATASGPRLARRAFCGRWALSPPDFSPENTGGKSRNLCALRGRLPQWIQLPASVAVPFGAFDAALAEAANVGVAGSSTLREIREAAAAVKPSPGMASALRAAFDQEGIPWPGEPGDGGRGAAAWSALAAVWASKWNDASYASCCKAGLPHSDVSMAVLCQQVVDARYSFVIHTTNPFTGDRDELYAELVCGLGEALVGNYSGRALGFSARKDDTTKITIRSFPSKSIGLFVEGPTIIFRSDSNAEDLQGYAGAGLYDSVIMDKSAQQPIDYSDEPLLTDARFREEVLRSVAAIGVSVEQAAGAAQDVEGVVDRQGAYFVVQTRPQV